MAQGPEAIDVIGMACEDGTCDWQPWRFQRRAPGDFDVEVDVQYCGVCHSDLHVSANHFASLGFPTDYPFVAGHEIAGVVAKVGSKVTRFRVGDPVGIGCMVDSCRNCAACKAGSEQKCKKPGSAAGIQTYGDPDLHGRAAVWPKGSKTKGGFCNKYVVHEEYGIRIPRGYPLEAAGPVMCSGITMYEPLIVHGMKAGSKVAFAGLGGLGGMGIMIAKQMGCVVTAISRGSSKAALAKELGADHYLDSKSDEAMAQSKGTLDLIINTIPIYHDINPYRALLANGGKLILIGVTPTFIAKAQLPCTTSIVEHSLIGGIKHTEEVLNLCNDAQPKILPKTVIKSVQDLNSIFAFLDTGNDTGERFVLDIKNSLSESTFGTCKAPKPKLQPAHGMSFKTVLYEWMKLLGCCCCQK